MSIGSGGGGVVGGVVDCGGGAVGCGGGPVIVVLLGVKVILFSRVFVL